MSDITWSSDQLEAIDTHNKNILVSAAAGSGKTAVLVNRLIKSILSGDLDVEKLVVVTFTKAAAAEMKARIRQGLEALLAKEPENVRLNNQITLVSDAQISTIDSFCLNIIRCHFEEAGIDPTFRLGEEAELKLLAKDVYDKLIEKYYEEANPEFMAFVKAYSGKRSDQEIENMVMRLYDKAVNNPWPKEWLTSLVNNYQVNNVDSPLISYLMTSYKAGLEGYIDIWQGLLEDYAGNEVFEKMLITIEEDLDLLDSLSKATSPKDLAIALSGVKLATKGSCKRSATEEEKAYANRYTELRKKLKDDLFSGKTVLALKSLIDDGEGGFISERDKLSKHIRVLVDITSNFIDAFDENKRDRNIISFNDMEHLALGLLVDEKTKERSQAALDLRDYYTEILIDEYQDSNNLQETILSAIAKEDNRYMVGDIKQSIYAFRSAKADIFLEKYKSYPLYIEENSESSKDRKILLKENFRSRKLVLDSANEIFTRSMNNSYSELSYRANEALVASAHFPEAGAYASNIFDQVNGRTCLTIISKGEDDDRSKAQLEASAIAEEIKKLTDGKHFVFDKNYDKNNGYRPITFKDIVILVRKKNCLDELVETLMNAGVKAHADSMNSYLETFEIRPIISFLSIVDNPLDDINFAAVCLSFFGNFTLDQLTFLKRDTYEYLYDSCKAFSSDPDAYMESRDWGLEPDGKADLLEKVNALLTLIKRGKKIALNETVYDLIWDLVYETGYYSYIDILPAADKRAANIDMLINRAFAFSGSSYQGLFEFLRYIEAIKESEEEIGEVSTLSENDDVVKIMTIHKSKGLEFPCVFVAGLSGEFSKRDYTGNFLISDEYGVSLKSIYTDRRIKKDNLYSIGLEKVLKRQMINEELRLLYVAMTRAKEKLYLVGTKDIVKKTDLRKLGKPESKELDLELLYEENAKKNPSLCENGLFAYRELESVSSYMDICLPIVLLNTSKEFFDINIYLSSDIEVEDVATFEDNIETIKENINTSKALSPYPFERETQMRPKVTVTELKTMKMDTEEEALEYRWPVASYQNNDKKQEYGPSLEPLSNYANNAAKRGSSYHKFMEHLDYGRIDSFSDIKEQLLELVTKRLLTEEEADSINIEDIVKFLESDIGKRASTAFHNASLKREEDFMIGIEEGDRTDLLIVQGTIDMYLEEEDSLVLLDYKTDYIPEGKGPDFLIKRYESQLSYYALALEKATGKKVKEKKIYSFYLGEEINLL